MGSGTILVTRDRIDEQAVRLLRDHGFECVFSPPYATPDEVVRTARDHNVCAIMVSQGKITDAVIGASGAVQVIVKHGSGVNNINLAAAERRGIPVYRAVGANAQAVAEHAIAMILALRKLFPRLDAATKSGTWLKGQFVGNDLAGSRLGLIGLGMIGHATARMALALGMRPMAYDPAVQDSDTEAAHGIEIVSEVDDLIQQADIISLHCPLVPATRHLVDAAFLKKMQRTAVLVNTARGGIVDEDALAEALTLGEIAGAGIDSFESEPPNADSPLWAAPNLIATPHSAGLTPGAERAMAMIAAECIITHFKGGVVDPAYRATSAALGGLAE